MASTHLSASAPMRVLVSSTFAFTICFAVWTIFAIIGIRIKEEVDKERAADWPDERLELVGLKRQTSDTFFIEIRRDAVPEQIGQGETHGAARIQEVAD